MRFILCATVVCSSHDFSVLARGQSTETLCHYSLCVISSASRPVPRRPGLKIPLRRVACTRGVQRSPLNNSFMSTSPLRILLPLLVTAVPQDLRSWSFRFYPPRCYQASLAGISSLLRVHLPPHTRAALESLLESHV